MKRIFITLFVCIFSFVLILSFSACGEEEVPETELCPDGEHEFLAWTVEKEARCNEEGIRSRTCVICKLYTQKQKITDATNHNYVDNICTYCGDSNAPENVGFVLSDDKTYYILYSVDDTSTIEYTIPPKHEGLPIKVIASDAFKECVNLEKIVIPNTVTTIEEGAFNGCRSLKTMTIPFVGRDRGEENAVFGYIFGQTDYPGSVGITQYPNGTAKDYWLPANLVDITITDGYLYEGCFENCTKIRRVSYEGEGNIVEDKAFNGCYSLTTITLLDTVKKYGDKSFQNCSALDTFNLDGIEEVGDYCFAGCNIAYLSTPSSLSHVGKAAFAQCSSLKTVFISSNLRTLSKQMFQDCISLESVEFENKVKTIGEACFSGCTALTEVIMPASIEEINDMAFKECTALTDITIPSSVKTLGEGAFQGCTLLKNVTIENGLESFGKYAFSSCTSLEEITLPASLKEIGENTFLQCASLKKILIAQGNVHFSQHDGNIYTVAKDKLLLYSPGNDQESFVIPEGVRYIDSSAFEYAIKLKEVVFPSTMVEIPDYLFYQNSTIKSIVIQDGTKKIDISAFEGCTALQSVTIKNVQTIGKNAFAHCDALKTVVIENVSEIDKNAFYKCPTLNSVSFTNVEVIGMGAFAQCAGLKVIDFVSGSIEVKEDAFSECSGLETLTIKCVKSLGEFAFSDCRSLKEVNIHADLTSIGDVCFKNCSSLTKIYIPSSITSLNASIFEGCYSLESFDLSETSTSFKLYNGHLVDMSKKHIIVFAPGQIKEETTIPSGVESIGTYAFRNATHMKKVSIPSSLKTIGDEAFYNTGLKEIDLNSVEVLGEFAFGKCLYLTEVKLPKSVTEVKDCAFQDCISLKKFYIRDTLTTMGLGIFQITDTLKEELKITEVTELDVFIEYKAIPETWNESWDAGRDFTEILNHSKF